MTAKIIQFPKQKPEEMYSDGCVIVDCVAGTLDMEWPIALLDTVVTFQDPNNLDASPAKPKSYFEMPDGTIQLNWIDKPHE